MRAITALLVLLLLSGSIGLVFYLQHDGDELFSDPPPNLSIGEPEMAFALGEIATPPGKDTSFALASYKIDPARPIQMYLKTDSNLAREGLDADATNEALADALSIWSSEAGKRLFILPIINNPSVASETHDGISVISFAKISNSYVGYARVWWEGSNVTEVDIVLNTNSQWALDPVTAMKQRKTDLGSIALHESGHGVGLKDLYNCGDKSKSSDLYQTMNYANARNYPRLSLGAGDINGVRKLYN